MTLDDYKHLRSALELLQDASRIITNVDITKVEADSTWTNQTQFWINSAIDWRNSYFKLLKEINK